MKSRPVILGSVVLAAAIGVWWSAGFSPQVSNRPSSSSIPSRASSTSSTHADSIGRWKALADDRLPWQQRVQLAQELNKPLSPEAIDWLFAELRRQPVGGENAQWVVQNEILTVMRDKGLAPERLTDELLAIMHDPSLHSVQRDYAAQHLAHWISPDSEEGQHETHPAKVDAGLKALAACVSRGRQSDRTLTGTALNALAYVSQRFPAERTQGLWDELTPIMTDLIEGKSQADASARVVAVQVAGMRQLPGCHEAVRRAATSEGTSELHIPAIAALGEYKNPEDRALLDRLAASDSRYRFAAAAALAKLPAPAR